MRFAAILVLAFCLCAPLAVAAPLDFVESADLANVNSGSADVGTFDVGVNTVVGSVDRGAGDTADFWDAALPADLEIVQIEIVVSGLFPTSSACRAWVEDAMVSGGDATLQAKEEFIRADGTVNVPATLGDFPFPFGQYFFLASALNLNASTRCDYEWRVTVVPEPGAGAGGCAALLAVGALARYSAKRGNYGK